MEVLHENTFHAICIVSTFYGVSFVFVSIETPLGTPIVSSRFFCAPSCLSINNTFKLLLGTFLEKLLQKLQWSPEIVRTKPPLIRGQFHRIF